MPSTAASLARVEKALAAQGIRQEERCEACGFPDPAVDRWGNTQTDFVPDRCECGAYLDEDGRCFGTYKIIVLDPLP